MLHLSFIMAVKQAVDPASWANTYPSGLPAGYFNCKMGLLTKNQMDQKNSGMSSRFSDIFGFSHTAVILYNHLYFL
ncbi:hypothetical protein SAMN05216325_13110 [Nitrosomonas marina]|uniref:Uncharacterized protein n=1 Tax=Nitrosomonas marina TaxID=917 RepID=A0A1H8ID39_9PROT|nr:hypothetical protein SAMN05216325_13110 [Nitrosomonas marina]